MINPYLQSRGFLFFIFITKDKVMIFKLTNTLSNKEYEFNVEDNKISKTFFSFTLTLPNGMDEGEYNFYVIDEDGSILSQGLLRYGDYKTENKAYNSQNKTFKQYRG